MGIKPCGAGVYACGGSPDPPSSLQFAVPASEARLTQAEAYATGGAQAPRRRMAPPHQSKMGHQVAISRLIPQIAESGVETGNQDQVIVLRIDDFQVLDSFLFPAQQSVGCS